MISRRLFLTICATAGSAAACASIPPDATRRANGVGDPGTPPTAPWRPEPAQASASEAKAEPMIGAVVYTCVMHPEIRQGGPGVCPKCGMPLVLKKPEGSL